MLRITKWIEDSSEGLNTEIEFCSKDNGAQDRPVVVLPMPGPGIVNPMPEPMVPHPKPPNPTGEGRIHKPIPFGPQVIDDDRVTKPIPPN